VPTNSADILRRIAPPVPPELAGRAEAWQPGSPTADPAPAASVVLLRESDGGLETYLLHRHARMAFAASMVVFPGGRMDPVDRTATDAWRACAVRETAEETGVRLDPAALLAWAEWTTPELEARRYRTKFYVATLPAGQRARDISGETDRADWSTPDAALAAAGAEQLALMPPTFSILLELSELPSLEAVREAADGRIVTPILPTLVRRGDGWQFAYPAGDDAE
jgi:8-oxo-dGTP pyrophosphatase MutT (NUDIX family)